MSDVAQTESNRIADQSVRPTGSALSDGVAEGKIANPPVRTASRVSRYAYSLDRMVFLVGFMGAGKTSLARRLAMQCGCASIDLDRYIERAIDCKISEYFEQEGEAAFRKVEEHVLLELSESDPAFVSCGGGIVESAANRAILIDRGFTIYMKVTPEEAASRITNHASRPLLSDMDEARARAQKREPLYEEVADAIIDTAGHIPGSLSGEVRRLLLDAGVLLKSAK